MSEITDITFSPEFVEKWKFVLKDLYHYKFHEEFAVVPSIWGKKTYSYLPLLNYTDRTRNQVTDMLRRVKNKDYQIRILNPEFKDFQDFDTVTMRIDLQKRDVEELFQAVVSKRNRRYIRQYTSDSTVIKKGNSDELVKDFYDIFAHVMHKHGTPVFSRKLFDILSKNLESTFYVLYDDAIPKAAAVILDDQKISWIPWSGALSRYMDDRLGLLLYWETIKDAFLKRKRIYDFGRSSYGSGTYVFKTRWDAIPVKIDLIKPRPYNVYKKYNYASTVWKKIPLGVARWFGPKVCKYLSDL
ncbi:MAG: GNAT family N-acetyltransferase [Candidatus Aminicenantes bacterium]|nr:MAG: GNAT family N-acetyltransferase [Candidatus Aminicenantes bacterium]